ncbi:MAG: MmcQ/YjbR family DNA-binding protein [Microbacterium sp.]
MATLDDVRRIAAEFPRVVERTEGHHGGASWRTNAGMLAWERPPSRRDLEQLDGLGRDWPDGVVIGVRVDGEQAKAALIETYPDAFFTIPHFDGYPAVLVRLDAIDEQLLRETLTDAWLLRVPPTVARAWLADHDLE